MRSNAVRSRERKINGTRDCGGESTILKPKKRGVSGFGGRRRKGRKIELGESDK